MAWPRDTQSLPLLSLLALTALSLPAVPTDPPVLNTYYETDLSGALQLTAEVENGVGPAFALIARSQLSGDVPALVRMVALDANGSGRTTHVFAPSALDDLQTLGGTIRLSAAMVDGAQLIETGDGGFQIDTGVVGDCLDFDYTIGDDSVMVAGRVITDQVQDAGIAISAQNTNGPLLAILFDSGNPTGGDEDLRTPNPGGVNNTEPLGNLLIIAENDVDANMDMLVDDPDDEAEGGTLEMTSDPATN